MRRAMLTTSALVTVGLMLASASCTGDESPTQQSSSTQPSHDSEDLNQLRPMLLTESDFPAGSQFQMSPDATTYGADVAAALKTTTFDPSACKEPREEQAKINAHLTRVGAGAMTPDGQRYQVSVTSEGNEPISLIKRMFFGDCADFTMERSINGRVVTVTRQRGGQVEQPTGLPADESFVYTLTNDVQSKLPGDTSPESHEYRLIGRAGVGDVNVWVEQTVSDRNLLDSEQFESIYRTAIDKALNAQ